MKIGSQIRKGTIERVKMAVGQDNSIISLPHDVGSHSGVPAGYLYELGLTPGDLIKLERVGLAQKGYTKNTWLEGDTLPNGRAVEKGQRYHGRGHRVRWVLIAKEIE